MYFFFDTETTGLPLDYRAPATDLDNWPRMVQLAWLLTDENAKELNSAECIIRPDGFKIPLGVSRIHGITTEKALECGIPLHRALSPVSEAIEEALVLVAHNMQFDEKILGAEFLRSGYPDPLVNKKRYCTMLSTTEFCRLPGRQSGYKWPKLQELHHVLFQEPFFGAHDALTDVRACARCFFELKRRLIIR